MFTAPASVRVVLSDGTHRDPPLPAALFVTVPLGHVFRALSVEEQRRAIEAGLTEALDRACAVLDTLEPAAAA